MELSIDLLKTFGTVFFLVGIIIVFFVQVFVEHYNNKKTLALLKIQMDMLASIIDRWTDQKTFVLIKDAKTGSVELKAISSSPRDAAKTIQDT